MSTENHTPCPEGFLVLSSQLLSYTKFLHLLTNLGLIGVGAVLLYVTIIAYTLKADDLSLLYNYAAANIMVITGSAAVLILAAVLGISSRIKMSYHGLLTSTIILSLLVVGTLGYAIWRGFAEDYTEKGRLHTQLYAEMQHYARHDRIIDTLQSRLSCCGVKSYADFGGKELPASCCRSKEKCDINNPFLHKKGCFGELRVLISYYNWMILIGLGFLSAIEIITIILSCMLCYATRRVKEMVKIRSDTEQPAPNPEKEETPVQEAPVEVPEEPKEDPKEEPAEEPKEEEPKCIQIPRVNISS